MAASTTAAATAIFTAAASPFAAPSKASRSRSSAAVLSFSPRLRLHSSSARHHVAERASGGSEGGAARAAAAAPAVELETTRSAYELETLTHWLLRAEQRDGGIDKELTVLLSSIAVACKHIATLVKRASISNEQQKLDVVANEVFCGCLRSSGRTGEENYVVLIDPLDGSSNIDAAFSSGSIFGIYEPTQECILSLDEAQQSCNVSVCQPGSNLLAAGYCLYSSAVILVLSIGDGVYGFTLDPLVREFVLTHRDIKIPKAGKIYSFDEGNYELWDAKLKKYVDSLKVPDSQGNPYSSRYIGSLVGDFHRTMLYGGIYGYPADERSAAGTLRLLYECAPVSFLAEQAGGKGSDGSKRILSIQPSEVHQRVPLYIGSQEEVEKLERYLA